MRSWIDRVPTRALIGFGGLIFAVLFFGTPRLLAWLISLGC